MSRVLDKVETYFKLNRFFLYSIGLWPYQTPWESRLGLIVLFAFTSSLFSMQFIGLVEVRNNMDDVIECLSPLGVAILCGIKVVNAVANSDKMKHLLTKIQKDWDVTGISDPEKTIMKKYAEEGVKFTKLYAYVMYTGMSFFILPPILSNLQLANSSDNKTSTRRRLPYIASDYIDTEKYFYLMTIHAYVATVFFVTIIIGVDSTFTVYQQHGCAKFAILRYAGEIESAYSTAQLFQVGTCCLLMSITGLHAVTKLAKPEELVRYFAVILLLMLHLLSYSWPSQELMDQSLSVHRATYETEWYRVSMRTRKLLLQIMTKSLKVCEITAGKFCLMSMENFCSILSNSMSYFTLLSSMHE
ncbi:odorant receptor 13a-like isoform X2 [Diprion similis]|uniref:odorant receptor 13a-like isoform X2 n=1 Tax=Diprion similis TaxID=362088 RepID=UPI001EF7E5DB|nr:odorant receptor 13a-like isoform X2 [Diprion similis]